MRRDWDAVVVGLGAIGSAAAYWLSARRGDRVLGLEQFDLDHPNGASHDHSRIIRRSYHRADYVRLAARAYEAWAAVERESGERIITRTGGIDIFPPGSAIPEETYAGAMRAAGVPHEVLDADETMRRWPQWRLAPGTRTLFQSDSGIADPFRANAAHRRLATSNGATLLPRTRVAAVSSDQGEAHVTLADGTRLRAGRVVLATDAWTNDLLAPLGAALPLTITKEQVTYIAAPEAERFAPERFPIWIWMDDPSFYGFPTYGEPGPKIGLDVGGQEVTPATRTFDRDDEAFERAMAFVAARLPGMTGPPLYTKTCLYTLTPDRDFVLDAVPGSPEILVALGAAHGFKFASVLGQILAELALDHATAAGGEIANFTFDRPTLREPSGEGRFRI